MVLPKESLAKKNIFAEKYDEIRRLDGNYINVRFYPFSIQFPACFFL
jgi:hypothetical protein